MIIEYRNNGRKEVYEIQHIHRLVEMNSEDKRETWPNSFKDASSKTI